MSTNTQTTGGGTATSFNKTPQAGDDLFMLNEDQRGTFTFDVMGNDAGGKAKMLWSLDNGDSSADLLKQDLTGATAESMSTDKSANGARIWIADGKVNYDNATLSQSFLAQLQSLAVGETLTDSFTYAIRLANGTLSWATARIQYAGENDAVAIGTADTAGAVVEDGAQSASGTINFSDIDLSDTHTATFAAVGDGPKLGTFAIGDVVEEANAANGLVGWTYTLDNAAAQYLAAGQTADEQYTVTISDPFGKSATTTVTVTITGTNDEVKIDIGTVAIGSVEEDVAPASASGTIDFTDVDSIDVHTVSSAAVGTGYLGTFSATLDNDSTGDGSGRVAWNFAVDNAAIQFLARGQFLTQEYTVSISDGNGSTATQTITILILGTNDEVIVTGAVRSGAVTEDTVPTSTSGTIDFTDVDSIDTHSVTSNATAPLYLGTFTAAIDNDSTGGGTGRVIWNFAVDNADVQFLAAGQAISQTYEVRIRDGNGSTALETVTITITGVNDAVTVTGAVAGASLTEDSPPTSAAGTIDFADVDSRDVHSVTFAPAGADYLGSFMATLNNDSTNDGTGRVNWNFGVANGALQFLAAGETRTQTYTVSINDGNGSTATQDITITLTGVNDAVAVVMADSSGAVTEDGTSAATGTITFLDIDRADGHTASSAANPANTTNLGTFALSPVSEAPNAASGSVAWNYTLNNAAAQYLAAGQIVVERFTVTIDDGNGSTATQEVAVTINGTNDAVTVTAAVATGAVTEDALPVSASGTIDFSDVDRIDTHTVSSAAAGMGYLGTFTATLGNDSTGDGTGRVNWSFAADNAALQSLAAGEIRTQTYTVSIDDGNGSTAEQTVTITITGVNDAAVITGATSGTIVEDVVPNAITGNLDATDVDGPNDSFVAVATAAASASGYGTYTVDAAGVWTYNLDNANPAVNALNTGQTLSDSFTVATTDGATQVVTITIEGRNDGVSVPAEFTGTGDPNDFDDIVSQNLNGGQGNDVIYGGAGDDTINGGAGTDTLYGGSGNDTISGGSANDIIYGGSGQDTIDGSAQNDMIYGGYGFDRLTGAGGQDSFIYLSVRDTGDSIVDYTPNVDIIDFSALDANGTLAGNQTFAFGGTTATANGVWYAKSGSDLIIYADTDGNTATAELSITLLGLGDFSLKATDFAL